MPRNGNYCWVQCLFQQQNLRSLFFNQLGLIEVKHFSKRTLRETWHSQGSVMCLFYSLKKHLLKGKDRHRQNEHHHGLHFGQV